MKSTDNKKARSLENKGLIAVNKGILTMSSLALSFNDVNFTPVQQDNQAWITSRELGQALGYSREDAVNKIFERNSDEFTGSMTRNVKLTLQGQAREVRVFSLRGCHLIAMLSRTAIAKQFRKWVLDVLDKHVGVPVAKTHKSERTPLHDAHAMLVAKTKHLNSSDAWKIINQRFGTEHIEDIPYEAIPVAVEYVHHLIAIYSSAEKKQFSEGDLHNLHALATHMIWARSWWQDFGDMIKKLNPVIYSRATTHFVDGSSLAWQFVRADTKQELKECVNNFNWLTGTYQQKLPI